MISAKNKIAAAILIMAAAVPNIVFADAQIMPMPADTRLVVFTFDQNDTYTVLARPKSVTDIQLAPEEEIIAMAIGDSVQWMVSKARGHVFIKPLQPNIFTSATVVTNARTYQLTLRSSPEDGKWYQRVSWDYPDLIVLQQQQREEASRKTIEKIEKVEREEKRLSEQILAHDVAIDNLNFDYEITGEAAFRPAQVFDDGKFTWVRLPVIQELPAVFMKDEEGKPELINYVTRGQYMMVQRLVPGLLLKIGKQEVHISNTRFKKKSSSLMKGWPW